jgi:hypothetical protein
MIVEIQPDLRRELAANLQYRIDLMLPRIEKAATPGDGWGDHLDPISLSFLKALFYPWTPQKGAHDESTLFARDAARLANALTLRISADEMREKGKNA